MASNWLEQDISGDAVKYFSKDKRMKALIINVENARPGASNDTTTLSQVLKKCGIEVQVCVDLTASGIAKDVENFKAELTKDTDCCWVFVMSHGNYGDIFYDELGTPLNFKTTIIEEFSTGKCSALEGKPKIIFADFCRGVKPGTGISCNSPTDSENMPAVPNKLATSDSDLFVCYATVPGYVSWRDETTGNWLIQCFCHVVEKLCLNKDDNLFQILTQVNHNIMADERQNAMVKTGQKDTQGNDILVHISKIVQVADWHFRGFRHNVFLEYSDLQPQAINPTQGPSEAMNSKGDKQTVTIFDLARMLSEDDNIVRDRETFHQHFPKVLLADVNATSGNVKNAAMKDVKLINDILSVWKSKNGKQATVPELIKILRVADYVAAADKIQDEIGEVVEIVYK